MNCIFQVSEMLDIQEIANDILYVFTKNGYITLSELLWIICEDYWPTNGSILGWTSLVNFMYYDDTDADGLYGIIVPAPIDIADYISKKESK